MSSRSIPPGWHSHGDGVFEASFLLRGRWGWHPEVRGWRQWGPPHIAIWEQVATALGRVEYRWRDCVIAIEADWPSVVRHLNWCLAASRKHGKATKAERKRLGIEFDRRERRGVRLHITLRPESEAARFPGRAEDLVQMFLHDIFLVINLAEPGACDFYNLTIELPRGVTDELGAFRFQTPLRLSSFYFESTYERDEKREWPSGSTLEVSTVCKWYYSVRTSFAQLPHSRAERALFGLLHVARGSSDITGVVWLFYGLESLLATTPGQNFSALHQRICLLLCPNEKQAAYARRELRTMYDLRSSFVHGGLALIHPEHNNVVDEIDKQSLEITETCRFGFAALVCVLQETIRRGWKEPKFSVSTQVSG